MFKWILLGITAVSVGLELGKSFSKEYDYIFKIIYFVIMILLTLIVLVLFVLHYKNKLLK